MCSIGKRQNKIYSHTLERIELLLALVNLERQPEKNNKLLAHTAYSWKKKK